MFFGGGDDPMMTSLAFCFFQILVAQKRHSTTYSMGFGYGIYVVLTFGLFKWHIWICVKYTSPIDPWWAKTQGTAPIMEMRCQHRKPPRLNGEAESAIWSRHNPYQCFASSDNGAVRCYDVTFLRVDLGFWRTELVLLGFWKKQWVKTPVFLGDPKQKVEKTH